MMDNKNRMDNKKQYAAIGARWVIAILAAALVLSTCGCGGRADGGLTGLSVYDRYDITEQADQDSSAMPSLEQSDGSSSDKRTSRSFGKEEVKLVYRARLAVQTTDYEETEQELVGLVDQLGGYFEYSHTDRGGYYGDGQRRSGEYIVRIPVESFEGLLSSIGDICHIVSLERSVEDIGAEYFDVETRLTTLRTKLDRLTDLLAQASVMSDIIELENSIADTQYDIDLYTSTLNRYDRLVDLSTVQISMQQVARLATGVADKEGFFQALVRSLTTGLADFADSVQDLVLWVAYNLMTLIALLAILVVGSRWYRKRRQSGAPPLIRWKKIRRKKSRNAQSEQAEEQNAPDAEEDASEVEEGKE